MQKKDTNKKQKWIVIIELLFLFELEELFPYFLNFPSVVDKFSLPLQHLDVCVLSMKKLRIQIILKLH